MDSIKYLRLKKKNSCVMMPSCIPHGQKRKERHEMIELDQSRQELKALRERLNEAGNSL